MEIEEDVNNRIHIGWLKQKNVYDVICDRKAPIKFKRNFAAKIRLLRQMGDHTRQPMIRNEVIRQKVGVAPIVEKKLEVLWQFNYAWRKPTEAAVRTREYTR